MGNLLCVERFVLESIKYDRVTLQDIHIRTGLKIDVVKSIVCYLRSRNIISFKDGQYFINSDSESQWKDELKTTENIKKETEDLFSQLSSGYFDSKEKNVEMGVQKVELDEFELKVLNSHLLQLKEFFRQIKISSTKASAPVKKKKPFVFLWATSDYKKLIQSSLA